VWWSQARPTAGELKATRIRDEVEGYLWPLYTRLLRRTPLSDRNAQVYRSNGGDGRYDIVLADEPPGGEYGESPLLTNEPTAPPARFSIVAHRLRDARLRAKVAHELMHGFLTGFRCAGQCGWLEEATATWAEHLAYPTVNTEHEYSKDYFADPTLSLDSDQGRHEFGAYMFLFFLQHRNGRPARDRTIVRSIWAAMERFSDPVAAFGASIPGGFSNAWRDFMTDNWNADPAVVTRSGRHLPLYWAWDRLSDGVARRQAPATAPSPGAATMYDIPATGSVTIQMNTTHPRLSAAYFVFRFAMGVRSVQLAHNTANVAGAQLVVLTRQGPYWTIQPNWTGTGTRSICLDRAGERFDEMVVIVGNASSTDVTFTPSLTATTNSCLGPTEGFAKCQMSFASIGSHIKDYQQTETQTWDLIPRVKVPTCTSTQYPYRWSTVGSGSSFWNMTGQNEVANWTLKGEGNQCASLDPQGSNKILKINSTGNHQHAVRGSEILYGSGKTPKVTDIDDARLEFESNPPLTVAAADATRIEGVALDQSLDPSWMAGENFGLVSYGTVSCRWSWPGAAP